MAAPGATPIILYHSTTAAAVPSAINLSAGELAINVTDKLIYSKNGAGAVIALTGTLAFQNANAVAITGGTITGVTDLTIADGGTGASTAANARTNLDVPSRTGSNASGTWDIDITGNAASATDASIAQFALEISNPGGWSVTPSGADLFFNYDGTNVGKLDSSGNLIVIGDVTAFGTL